MVGAEYVIVTTRVSEFGANTPTVVREQKLIVTNKQSYDSIVVSKFNELHTKFNEKKHLVKVEENNQYKIIKTV